MWWFLSVAGAGGVCHRPRFFGGSMPRRIPTARPPWQPDTRRLYDATPARRADIAWYHSAAWRRCRAAYLAAYPLCEDCQAAGRLTAAQHVHHIVPRKQCVDPYAWEGLCGLCIACHNRREHLGPADSGRACTE